MTSAPDEKTCEKSEFQGHATGYREMGEVVCKAHRMTSTAGNGTEQPISAAQAKMRLPSLPVERSVFFLKVLKYIFPLFSSQCRGILFVLHTSCERRRRKIHYLGLRLSEQVCWSSSTVALKRKTRAYVIIMNAALLLSGVRDGVVSAGVPSMLGVWDRVW